MILKRTLTTLWSALARPAAFTMPETGLLRTILRQRRIFDLVSWAMQARRLGLVAKIELAVAGESDHVATSREANAQVTKAKLITTTRRAEPIYRIATRIDSAPAAERLLIVGPRNVQELLIAWLHGFSWDNIAAIDLYSTHPKIAAMDMHDITLPPESVDVVTMVNTLSYSSEIPLVLRNVARVLKPGGRFCFSHTHWPEHQTWPGTRVPIKEVLAACEAAGLRVYHHEWTAKTNAHGGRQLNHYIGAAKETSEPESLLRTGA